MAIRGILLGWAAAVAEAAWRLINWIWDRVEQAEDRREIMASVKRGLRQKATIYKGSFARYVKEGKQNGQG